MLEDTVCSDTTDAGTPQLAKQIFELKKQRSQFAGAQGVSGSGEHHLTGGFAWHEERLQFAVREPFPSLTTGTDLIFGTIEREQVLTIESQMPERGVIFSDGMERDYISFNAGTVATIGIANEKGRLVVR